jgi:hypothetical protein
MVSIAANNIRVEKSRSRRSSNKEDHRRVIVYRLSVLWLCVVPVLCVTIDSVLSQDE